MPKSKIMLAIIGVLGIATIATEALIIRKLDKKVSSLDIENKLCKAYSGADDVTFNLEFSESEEI